MSKYKPRAHVHLIDFISRKEAYPNTEGAREAQKSPDMTRKLRVPQG